MSFKANRTLVWIVILSTLLPACSVFSPVKVEPMTEYVINTLPAKVKTAPASGKTLSVSLPLANTIYNTKEMAYSTKPYRLNYFAKNSWGAAPPQMLQPLIIQSLQNTHYFRAVSPTSAWSRPDFVLNTQLLEFYQEFSGCTSVYKVTLRAQIQRTSTHKVIASKEFSVVEVAPLNNPYGGVIAANQATSRMLSQLAAWSVNHSY